MDAATVTNLLLKGPPGTGKTCLALKAMRALIDNPQLITRPILVIALTNHALDQLVEVRTFLTR